MRKMILAVGAAGVVMTGAVSLAQAATLTGSQLSGVGLLENTTGTSATYSGGIITLSSPDNVSGGTLAQFNDTATANIPSGYLGTTSLGTLNNFLTNYTSSVSFDIASATAQGGQYAYWNVELQDPNNSAVKVVLNAYGDNNLGANGWNGTTSGGYAFTSGVLSSGVSAGVGFGSSWATAAATTYDGTALGTWSLIALTISVGGWNTNSGPNAGGTQTDTIDSITLPGSVTATPLPAALPLFAGGLGVMGLFGWRRKRKAQASV